MASEAARAARRRGRGRLGRPGRSAGGPAAAAAGLGSCRRHGPLGAVGAHLWPTDEGRHFLAAVDGSETAARPAAAAVDTAGRRALALPP